MVMNHYRNFILLIVISLFANACELSNDINVELPSGESFPLIEAYLLEGEPIQILAFKSNTLHEPVRINMLWNASVYIISGADSLKLKNLIKIDRNSDYLYNYLQDTIVSSRVDEFCLYIESDEFSPISGTCKPVGNVEIEQISLNESMILDIKSTNLDDPTNNYYQVRCHEYSAGKLSDIHQFEVDLHEKPEGAIEITYPLQIASCDSLRVDLYRLDALAYKYHRSISNALNANSDPFTTPSPFSGNLTNARGIFTYVCRDSHTFSF
jgi:Domain of unknown function (DUF4249)